MNDDPADVTVGSALKDAMRRMDGIAAYISTAIFVLAVIVFSVTDFWMNYSVTARVKLVTSSAFMIPIPMFIYLCIVSSERATRIWMVANAVGLLAIPVYFYSRLF